MAKSSRASTTKANNQRLKKNVFGPVEAERTERLSAKLLELAKQPKPERDETANVTEDDVAEEPAAEASTAPEDASMDIDAGDAKASSSSANRRSSGRIQKKKKKASSRIAFPSYKDRKGKGKKKA